MPFCVDMAWYFTLWEIWRYRSAHVIWNECLLTWEGSKLKCVVLNAALGMKVKGFQTAWTVRFNSRLCDYWPSPLQNEMSAAHFQDKIHSGSSSRCDRTWRPLRCTVDEFSSDVRIHCAMIVMFMFWVEHWLILGSFMFVFWAATRCGLFSYTQTFRNNLLPPSATLKMEVASPHKTLVSI